MDDLRNLAIQTLSRPPTMIPTAQKAAFARDYEIKEWILPSLRELARRKQALTLDEGNALGMDWTIRLANVRESFVPPSRSNGQVGTNRPPAATIFGLPQPQPAANNPNPGGANLPFPFGGTPLFGR